LNPYLNSALAYAKRGWYVFPLTPGKKSPPLVPHGCNDATTSEEQIREWWEKWPDANIGVNCGMSGLVVLDVDTKKGKVGGNSLIDLIGDNFSLLDTVHAHTWSGGSHYFYKGQCKSSASKLAKDLDIKGEGGYVVLSPSEVREAGLMGRYRWEKNEGEKLPIAPFPDLFRPKEKVKSEIPIDDAGKVPHGSGHAFLLEWAGKLRRIGLSETEIYALLKVKSEERLAIPASDAELQKLAKSIAKLYAPAPQKSTPPAPSLALPNGGEVMTDEELIASCEVEIAWQIEGFVQRSGLLLLSALPKVGKSDLARNMARAVSSGEDFLGRRTTKGRVLWIGLAEPRQKLVSSIETMDLAGRGIVWVTTRPAGPWQPWLAGVIETFRPDFAIIDEIGRLATDLESINDYSQVIRATQPFLDLRSKYGTTFVLIHHNNKLGGTAGSTAWEGAVDCVMSLTRTQDHVRTIQTKQRLGEDLEATVLERDPNTGLITCTIPKTLADQRHAENGILSVLTAGQQMTRQELADLGSRGSYVGRCAVDALLAAGLIEVTGTGRRGDPRRYQRSAMFPPGNTSDSSGGSGISDIALNIPEEYPKHTRGKPEETRGTRDNPSHPKIPEPPEETGPGLNGRLTHDEFRLRGYDEPEELPY
jgi:hypothetical protein